MKKVLFIDDEPNILQALKRTMTLEKKEWEMVFFSEPEKALAYLRENRVSVIVTDYTMPGMSGLDLVIRAREINPDIYRILLSGQSDTKVYEKTMGLVDRYFPKPCDTAELVAAIDQAKEL